MLEEAKREVVAFIVDFRMHFRHSTLFMIRRKYPELDLSNVDLTQMERYNVFDLADGSAQADEGVLKEIFYRRLMEISKRLKGIFERKLRGKILYYG